MLPLLLVLGSGLPAMAPVPAHAPASMQQPAPTLPFEMRELNEAENAALPQGEGRDAVADDVRAVPRRAGGGCGAQDAARVVGERRGHAREGGERD
jgi:hypothetical protein